ncbi:MAG: hypothetical protein F4Z57_17915 [Gemmatimonadetes bacterium]|nr:hypothetical protein [Gemmatimonadota bacterium]MYC70311.1 hypothetical protein [Gemmatimonadota bacterium]
MNRWNFEWWHFFALYAALITINAVTAITQSEIGVIGAYLTILAMLFVSASMFYQMLKKKATAERGNAMNRWNFKWWHVLALYCAALIGINVVTDIIKQEIGTIGAYLTLLAVFLVANLFYHVLKKKAADAS